MNDKTIAVVGASADRNKFGNKCVRAFAHAGWTVYPINPKAEPIEGWTTFAKLADVPTALDGISVYLPPARTAQMLDEIAAADADRVWFNPGAADSRVLDLARQQGLPVRDACSIVDIGLSPSQFP